MDFLIWLIVIQPLDTMAHDTMAYPIKLQWKRSNTGNYNLKNTLIKVSIKLNISISRALFSVSSKTHQNLNIAYIWRLIYICATSNDKHSLSVENPFVYHDWMPQPNQLQTGGYSPTNKRLETTVQPKKTGDHSPTNKRMETTVQPVKDWRPHSNQ